MKLITLSYLNVKFALVAHISDMKPKEKKKSATTKIPKTLQLKQAIHLREDI